MDVRVRLIKKAECWRINAFQLCWRRLLRVPWTAGRSNQETLKTVDPEFSLEGLMLKLKLKYFGHVMGRANSLEKTLMLRKKEVRRRREWQSMRWLVGITDSMDLSLSNLWDIVKDRKAWRAAVYEIAKSQTWLSNWKIPPPQIPEKAEVIRDDRGESPSSHKGLCPGRYWNVLCLDLG